jgi:predicted Zn-dependent protease
MANPYQEQFDESRRLRDQGDLAGARRLLENLVASQPRSATLFALLGNVYWDQGLLAKAISSFRTAVEISPKAELASLGLFHTLWQNGQEGEAFDEMRRFTRIGPSPEYSQLLRELNAGEGVEVETPHLIDTARQEIED